MTRKSEQIQIRVTPHQKAALKRRAEHAGQDVSSYVLSRTLPPGRTRFEEIIRALRTEPSHRFALAELNDFLSTLAPAEFPEAVSRADLDNLSAFLQSYVAAMVEVAATNKGIMPPAWAADVPGLDEPYFATPMRGLRLHLLRSAPVPFKRRNLFVDSTVGDRV
jgi:hypothetical protein